MTRSLTGIPRQRLKSHGDFDASASASQRIKGAITRTRNWYVLHDAHKEALQMIAFKIARILSGDPDHLDHWDDIQGYAQLGARACKRKGRKR